MGQYSDPALILDPDTGEALPDADSHPGGSPDDAESALAKQNDRQRAALEQAHKVALEALEYVFETALEQQNALREVERKHQDELRAMQRRYEATIAALEDTCRTLEFINQGTVPTPQKAERSGADTNISDAPPPEPEEVEHLMREYLAEVDETELPARDPKTPKDTIETTREEIERMPRKLSRTLTEEPRKAELRRALNRALGQVLEHERTIERLQAELKSRG